MKLSVVCWLWKQEGCRTEYSALHVNILAAMVKRHLTLPHTFSCVTDMPEGIDPSVRIIKPPGEWEDLKTARWKGGRPSCFRRLTMFRPDAARIFGRRIAAIDLDCVIGGNVDSVFDRPEDIVLLGPSRPGNRWVYNGSLLLLKAGSRPNVYTDFTPQKAEEASRHFVGSDQAWLAYALGRREATWGHADGVVRWGDKQRGAMMFFPGNVKPWDAMGDDWVARHYRLAKGRSGLVLGDKRTVWDDATRAMRRRKFDHVVALPGAAEAWPGKVDAVARDIVHAGVLARMLGVDRPVFCGA